MTTYLSYAADLLMIAASLGAATYCMILSRRLSRLTSFDKGIGGAIAVLSQQVDEMKAALSDAKAGTEGAGQHLRDLVRQAREISGELELMIAACHDFAEQAIEVQASGSAVAMPSSAKSSAQQGAVAVEPLPGPAPGSGLAAAPVSASAAVSGITPVTEVETPVPTPDTATGDPVPDAPAANAIPTFGSRRAQADTVMFRRHGQA